MLRRVRDKHLDTWLVGYARHLARLHTTRKPQTPAHLLFAFCDHYEPLWGGADEATGIQRVRAWVQRYPEMTQRFRDADGRTPQHTFFFPGEQSRPRLLDGLDNLVRGGCGEVELHLHHDGSTEQQLREDIATYLGILGGRGHFARDAQHRMRFAFIHGNWALANSRPDGRRCGVDAELPVLFDAGCYADFTFPSAPDPTQPSCINLIYWPTGDLSRRRAYENASRARVGQRMRDRLLMMQGPLSLARRPGSLSVRIENGAVTARDPPSPSRIRSWVDQRIHVRGRPEWVFVKVYTHGAPEPQAASLLGEAGAALHEHLCTRYNDGVRWRLHYVTAREMFNVACAAMDGHDGDPNRFRDYLLAAPPIRSLATPSRNEDRVSRQ